MTCPICGSKLKDDARFCSSCGANTAGATTGRLQAGRILAERYQIVRLLARGGMGAVYLAVDTRLDGAQVAVKEMAGVYRPGETDAFAQAVAEFRREAALLARLSHPNLPRVIDRFEQDGKQFLVMEYVEGQTLRQALNARGGRAEVAEVLAWAEQLCAVLAYLHAQNPPIIYRDLKPGNVMLRPDGRVALIDFGIARFYKPGKASDTAIYGTLGYAAPEQYGEGQTDQRSDIYALGVLLYHALTGYDVASTPFRLPDLSHLRPDVPILLANLIARATALEPAERFASATEVADALLRARLDDGLAEQERDPAPAQPAQRQRRGLPLWGFGALLALLVALAAGMALGRTPGEATHAGITQAPAATADSSLAGQAITATAVAEPDPPPDMVRVPAGSFTMGSDDDQTARPAHVLDLPAFLIDRIEVTNRAYRACVLVQVCQPPQRPSSLTHEHYYDSADFDTYPVVYVTWEDAQTYCAWRGRRLPTEAEWEKAARGADGRLFPWGNDWDETRAWVTGGDDASRDLAPVGSIPRNASPYGALDMSGNAWEWTSSRDLSYPYAGGDGREARATAGQRVTRGGAWGHDARNARVTTRDPKDPREGFWNRGFRCAATPETPPLSRGAPANQPPAPPGMVAVPGGLARLGTSQAEGERWVRDYHWSLPLAEFPQHSVTIAPFFLDRAEVTNEQYAAFVAARKHAPPANPFDPAGLNIWRGGTYPPALAHHPVVNVTWTDAREYCAWAGKRLPTEAEWEWAARGPAGWLWPWGNTFDQQRTNTQERRPGGTLPVGAAPANASWVGALDLAGNVWEWMSSLGLPYPYDPTDGREDPARPGPRAIRGGSWTDPADSAHTSGRNQFDPALANINIGFRCARSQGN